VNSDAGAERLEFFAACPRQVPDLLAAELRTLGLEVTRTHPAGVSFEGPVEHGLIACLHSRTASRVVLAIATGPAADAGQFYELVRALPWEDHVAADGTIAVDVVGQGPAWVRRTTFAAQKAKDGIVDRFRERSGARPSVDLDAPDLRVSVRFGRDRATVGIDLAGQPLHQRGYRQSALEAPLKENLAAALLLRCGWPEVAAEGGAFVDPMCGSGTLVIEAALVAARIAPGLLRRRFGFERWRQHNPALWARLREEALATRSPASLERGRLRGYDRDQAAIRASLANTNRAGLAEHLTFERREVSELPVAPEPAGLVLVNPPYGARLGEEHELEPVYTELGQALLRCHSGWQAGVFTGNPRLGRALGLRAYRTHTFYNGPIEGRLLRFRVEAGAVAPDPESQRRERLAAARARPGAAMFANRLRKNLARLTSWARREDVSCFRAYDADMPEYAFAVDIYGNDARHACVQEYSPPVTVAAEAARQRRDEVISVLPEVLDLPEERIHLKTRQRQRAGTQYERAQDEGRFHEVREGRYRFLVNFDEHLDTGLFLDHRLTRLRLGELAQGKRFLNLFAYTGTATVHAVGSGAAASTSVDMSRTYLDWARRNLVLNELAGPAHGFVQADCLAWLEDEVQQHRRPYGLIFVDPPTHSRSKRMSRDFDVQRDHVELLRLVARLLEPGGAIVFSNNYQRFRIDAAALPEFEIRDITRETIAQDFARNPRIHHCFFVTRRAS
jgi:23S rRNA (guanine2445-N2)-methyltransferase / 23S rRNA (guanine2069-N7)-methyltransferase